MSVATTRVGKVVVLLFIAYVQAQVWIGAFTLIVCATGEGNPSTPSTIERQMPAYFWSMTVLAITTSNALFYFWVKRVLEGRKRNGEE